MTKKTYREPNLLVVPLDNEIALVLSSSPPIGPGESGIQMPNEHEQEPYE